MAFDFALTPVAPGRWSAVASPAWVNPRRGLWGGFAIGLCVHVLKAEPQATGDPLSLALSFVSALPEGRLDVSTRCLRQGRSIGVWEVEIRPAGAPEVCIHAVVTAAKRPSTPRFRFVQMPVTPPPEDLPVQQTRGNQAQRDAFEWRGQGADPPPVDHAARTLAWVRSRQGPLDRALLGVVTDASPPRVLYALGDVMNTTLCLSVYFHATAEQLSAVGDDWILVEYDGRVGGGGASDERSSYWSRDGQLLATSEQLVWYRDTPEA
jgi:acyl-CoA thioesterase